MHYVRTPAILSEVLNTRFKRHQAAIPSLADDRNSADEIHCQTQSGGNAREGKLGKKSQAQDSSEFSWTWAHASRPDTSARHRHGLHRCIKYVQINSLCTVRLPVSSGFPNLSGGSSLRIFQTFSLCQICNNLFSDQSSDLQLESDYKHSSTSTLLAICSQLVLKSIADECNIGSVPI